MAASATSRPAYPRLGYAACGGLLLVVALLAACYRPTVVDCKVGCGANNACPSGMHCSDGLCTRGPSCQLSVAAGEVHSCALHAGLVKCWGGNRYGQLGIGDTLDRGAAAEHMGTSLPAVDLGAGRTAVAVAAGGRHTCALLDQGEVKCWGDNAVGQLGLGDRRSRITPDDLGKLMAVDLGTGQRATAIAAGLWHTCAVLEQGLLKCWGDNRFGQLGLGHTANRGDDPDEMGDKLAPVDLGTGARVLAVAPGAYHTCALLGTGQVKCWGPNERGELGVPPGGAGSVPGTMGDALAPIALARKVANIAAGAFHTCAVLEAPRDVKCWGANYAGQLGLGLQVAKFGDGMTGVADLPSVDLGIEHTAHAIGLGAMHSCAVLEDGQVRCWGYAFDGELGIGSTQNRGLAAAGMGDALPPVALVGTARSLAVGGNHACAVVTKRVYCWGLNRNGQLGVGDDKNRGDKSIPFVPVDLGLP